MSRPITITNLSHDGRGIAYCEGKTTFIENALIGEEVHFQRLRHHSKYDEGIATEILKTSPHRVQPPCSFSDICGGCSLQHINPSEQINFKEQILLEQLQHMGRVIPKIVLPPLTGPTEAYRTKARLGVKFVDKKGKLLIGFHEKKGRYLADIESCTVLHPSIGLELSALKEFIGTLSAFRTIPQLEIAVGEETTAIILRHMEDLSAQDLLKIEQFAQQKNFHIYLQPEGPESAYLFFPKNHAARLNYYLRDYDLEFLFHPTDFTQINRAINQRLVNLALKLLEPAASHRYLDLYCGIGNFTLPLARFSEYVVGIEGSELMVNRAQENAVHNKIENVAFHCMNLAGSFYNNSWKQHNFDGVLLDPPRTGAKEMLSSITQLDCKRIVYVSCNPATLARDAGLLKQSGYELSKVGVLDMFPHTTHVESIALFTR